MDAEVAIVGGGVVGLSAAWALARRGAATVLLDPLPRATERNASNDESKVFRVAYGPREDYARLAQAALRGWRDLERASGRAVLHPHGLVMLARAKASFADASRATFARLGLDAPAVDAAELERRWPAFQGGGFTHAVLDPAGGLLDPPEALAALEEQAVAAGARIVRGEAVVALGADGGRPVCALDGGGRVAAGAVVVAAGYRAPLLLQELAPVLAVSRQPEFFYEPPAARAADYAPPRLPVFAAFEDGFYGFPLHRGAVKVADHRKGPAESWEPSWDPPRPGEAATVRRWVAQAMPGLAAAPLARSRVCHYDNTPDDDFLLGWHPSRERVLLAAGLSGHGFKFGPALGELLADLALGRPPPADLRAFAPGRLLR